MYVACFQPYYAAIVFRGWNSGTAVFEILLFLLQRHYGGIFIPSGGVSFNCLSNGADEQFFFSAVLDIGHRNRA